MSSRNTGSGSKSSVIEHIQDLAYFMKVGARLIAIEQIHFQLNDWSNNKLHEDGGPSYWMKQEKIEVFGRVSWNKKPKTHTWYKYTKISK